MESTESMGTPPPPRQHSKSEAKRWIRCKRICLYALIGYTLGIITAVICFVVLIKYYNLEVIKAAWISAAIGMITILSLSFSKSVRCNIVLVLPIICSVKGRSFLIAYALVLTGTGPCLNITKNFLVLSKSLSCGQEQLKEAIQNFLEIIKSPLVAVKKAIKIAIFELKKILRKIERIFKEVVKLIKKILSTIKNAFSWLSDRSAVCNKELGNPFQRCIQSANETINECEAKMESLKDVCQVTQVFTGLCYTLKLFDFFCDFQTFVSDKIINEVIARIKKFQEDLHNIFDASIKFDHDFNFSTNQSKEWSEVGDDIMFDVNNDLKSIFVLFSWTQFLAMFMFLRLYLKSMYYKYKYMKSNSFDNYFITKDFKEIDEQRKRMDKETALPLTRKERSIYVHLSSFTLVSTEILKMVRSVIFLFNTTIQIVCICLIDLTFYSILELMQRIGKQEEPLKAQKFVGIDVSGSGYLAEIYRGVIRSFEPLSAKYDMNHVPCLPNPYEINLKRYCQIGAIMSLCWMFLILEPYFLRVRQIIMKCFYPDRAKERAVWLYNQVLLRRSSFIKMARRQARSKILKDSSAQNYSCMDWIRAKTNSWFIFRKIFGEGTGSYCILCASYLKGSDLVKCQTPQCKGVYCSDCFRESENKCCLCKSPIEYGDASDISEEIDSDELSEVKVNKYCP